MKKSQSPRIVNITSRLGTRPMEDSLVYFTSEVTIIMMTKCCALKLAKYNIKVNTAIPSLLAMQSYSLEEIANLVLFLF